MSDQPSRQLEPLQIRRLFYQAALAKFDITTPPDKLEAPLSNANSAMDELLQWGLPYAVRLPEYAGSPEAASAL